MRKNMSINGDKKKNTQSHPNNDKITTKQNKTNNPNTPQRRVRCPTLSYAPPPWHTILRLFPSSSLYVWMSSRYEVGVA